MLSQQKCCLNFPTRSAYTTRLRKARDNTDLAETFENCGVLCTGSHERSKELRSIGKQVYGAALGRLRPARRLVLGTMGLYHSYGSVLHHKR